MKKRNWTTSFFLSVSIGILFALSLSCTKTVQLPIPDFEEQLVVDGTIETGMPPIVILSMSKNLYSATNTETFLNSFITDANVFVSDGTTEVQLSLLCSNDLPPGSEDLIAGLIGVSVEQLSTFNVCAYTSMNTAIWGQVGKNYSIRIEHLGKTYTGNTQILQPKALDSLWWESENSAPGFGYSHARLSDAAGTFDAYSWQVKRINLVNGTFQDPHYKPTFSSVIDDEFFDGMTFDFYYENPWNIRDESIPSSQRGYFKEGDTIVVKFSKIDKGVYEFLYSKFMQNMSSGNPFASYLNVKSNLNGGCLGVWAGYSPAYDTIVCQ